MPFIFTCDSPSGDVIKSYPDGAAALKLCVDDGSNCFSERRIDAIQVGDRICHYLGQPGPSLEVTQVQVV